MTMTRKTDYVTRYLLNGLKLKVFTLLAVCCVLCAL